MTTIAYRDGVLAGDTRETDDGTILHDKCEKVFKLPNGSLFGAAGDSEACLLLLDGIEADVAFPPLPHNADLFAVLITPDGKIFLFEGARWTLWPEKFIAIGSGRQAALALLRYGASAVDAVKGGISVDPYSGGRVRTVKLKGKK